MRRTAWWGRSRRVSGADGYWHRRCRHQWPGRPRARRPSARPRERRQQRRLAEALRSIRPLRLRRPPVKREGRGGLGPGPFSGETRFAREECATTAKNRVPGTRRTAFVNLAAVNGRGRRGQSRVAKECCAGDKAASPLAQGPGAAPPVGMRRGLKPRRQRSGGGRKVQRHSFRPRAGRLQPPLPAAAPRAAAGAGGA
jgi:hypothetical protein